MRMNVVPGPVAGEIAATRRGTATCAVRVSGLNLPKFDDRKRNANSRRFLPATVRIDW